MHRSVLTRVIHKSRLGHPRPPNRACRANHNDASQLAVPRASTCLGRSVQWHRRSATLRVKTFITTALSWIHESLSLIRSYNLPEPSRPRENTVNIFDPNYKTPQFSAPANTPITPVNNFNNRFGYSLVPIYIPNQGYRYFVVVPVDKWNYLNTNLIRDDRDTLEQQKFEKSDKLNGRYNAKLKKYKAYEKSLLKPQQVGTTVRPALIWLRAGNCRRWLSTQIFALSLNYFNLGYAIYGAIECGTI